MTLCGAPPNHTLEDPMRLKGNSVEWYAWRYYSGNPRNGLWDEWIAQQGIVKCIDGVLPYVDHPPANSSAEAPTCLPEEP